MNNYVISLIRTGVPTLVSVLTVWLISNGVELDANTTSGLVAFLTGVLSWVYYVVARWLEIKWPKFGILLGVASKPTYK